MDKDPKEVDVYVDGNILTDEQKDTLREKLRRYNLSGLKLVIHSTSHLKAMRAIRAEPDVLKQLYFKTGKKIEYTG